MSVAHGIILLNQTKGKLMGNLIEALCAVCNATTNCYSVVPNELCAEHYFEWSAEKGFMELSEREDYFHLV
jgi:hypothetical protein